MEEAMKSSVGESMLDRMVEYRVIAWLKERGIDEDRPLMPREIAPVIAEFAKQYYADALRLIEEYERLRVLDYQTRNVPIIVPRESLDPLFTTTYRAPTRQEG